MIRRVFGVLGTVLLAGGFAAAIPVFSAVLAATFGMLTVVGLYVMRSVKRRRPVAKA